MTDARRASPHPLVVAFFAIVGWWRAKSAGFVLAIALLMLCGAWSLARQVVAQREALAAPTQEVPARVVRTYWRALPPDAKHREYWQQRDLWYQRWRYVAVADVALREESGAERVVAIEDPQGATQPPSWPPPKTRFSRALPHLATELRLDRETLERYRAEPSHEAYGARSRPDWRKSTYDAMLDRIDDPLAETLLAWTHPADPALTLSRDPRDRDALLLKRAGGADFGTLPLLAGPGMLALFLAGFGLAFSALAFATYAGGSKGRRGYLLAYLAMLATLPWWSPHMMDAVRWLSPEVAEGIEGELSGMSSAGAVGAPRASALQPTDPEGVVRYDIARSAYAPVWRRFQLVRPADCCATRVEAFRAARAQVDAQARALDDDAADALARELVDLEAAGHGHVSVLFIAPLDAISRDPKGGAELRRDATTALEWIARFPDVDRDLEAAWVEDLQRLVGHPDRDVVESARMHLDFYARTNK